MPQCICDLPGYNSWPMISRAGNRLICLYSRGSEHTIDEPSRGIYARYSDDEGIHWSCEVMVNNDSEAGDVPIGKGMDPEDGSVLFFVRRCTKGLASLLHDLYRTTDGIHFQRIATLDLDVPPMQITDILILEEGVWMALWFAGDYSNRNHNSWGTLVSYDKGLHWKQNVVDNSLPKDQWPTEPSAVYLGNGRLLAVARREYDREKPESILAQFQLESVDYGKTWSKALTNITDISESTPSLILTPSGKICNYYYQRFAGFLKRRTVSAEAIWGNPTSWSEPEILLQASTDGCNAGNVNSTVSGGKHILAYYSGDERNTSIYVHVADGSTE